MVLWHSTPNRRIVGLAMCAYILWILSSINRANPSANGKSAMAALNLSAYFVHFSTRVVIIHVCREFNETVYGGLGVSVTRLFFAQLGRIRPEEQVILLLTPSYQAENQHAHPVVAAGPGFVTLRVHCGRTVNMQVYQNDYQTMAVCLSRWTSHVITTIRNLAIGPRFVVHGHGAHTALALASARRILPSVRIVYTVHDMTSETSVALSARVVEHEGLECVLADEKSSMCTMAQTAFSVSNCVAFVSSGMMNQLNENDCELCKMTQSRVIDSYTAVPWGIEDRLLISTSPRAILSQKHLAKQRLFGSFSIHCAGCIAVLFVGRPEVSKGWNVVLQVLSQCKRGSTVVILIVFPLVNIPLHSSCDVILLTTKALQHAYTELARSAADILFAPSQSEGYGLTVSECLAHACFPVTSSAAGFSDTVGDQRVLGIMIATPTSARETVAFANSFLAIAEMFWATSVHYREEFVRKVQHFAEQHSWSSPSGPAAQYLRMYDRLDKHGC